MSSHDTKIKIKADNKIINAVEQGNFVNNKRLSRIIIIDNFRGRNLPARFSDRNLFRLR